MKVLVTKITGLHCGSCLGLIERIGKAHGASHVDINLQTNIGKLYYEETFDEQPFLNDVSAKGYDIEKLTLYDESEII